MLAVVTGAWLDAGSEIEVNAGTNNILDAIMSDRHFGIIAGGSDRHASVVSSCMPEPI